MAQLIEQLHGILEGQRISSALWALIALTRTLIENEKKDPLPFTNSVKLVVACLICHPSPKGKQMMC